MSADPVGVVGGRRGRGHDQERVGRLAGDSQIGLDAAARVEHLRVDHAADRNIDVVGAEPLERVERVGAVETQLGKRGLVEEPDRLPHRAVLGGSAAKPVLPPVAVSIHRLHAGRRVPVGALPAHHHAEARAARGEPIVERAPPHPARGGRLQVRPVRSVGRADHLARALPEIARVALERSDPADVDVPEIHRRLAPDDPLGHRLPRPRPRRDADGIEPGGHEELAALRRLAKQIAPVRREALRPVDVTAHGRRLDRGDADDRLLHQHLEVLPVLGQQREREVSGDPVGPPRLGLGLEAAHEQTTDLLPHVDVPVGVAQHRKIGRHPGHGLGHDVEVLGGVQRHRDPGHVTDLARPHARAVHHDLARHVAAGGTHAGHAIVLHANARHRRVLEDRRPALARALGQRERGVDGIRAPVARQPQGTDQIIRAHQRPAAPRLGRCDDFHVDPEASRHRGQPLQLVHALSGSRHAHAAGTAKAGRLAGLGFQSLVQLGPVLGELGEVLGGAKLSHEPRRVPGRSAGDVAPLQQQHVAPAKLGQVIGNATPGDAAADHDHSRVRGKRAGHEAIREFGGEG